MTQTDEGARSRPRETWAMQTSVLVDVGSISMEVNCKGVELSEEMRAEYNAIFDNDLTSKVEEFRLQLAEHMQGVLSEQSNYDQSIRSWTADGANPSAFGKYVRNFRSLLPLNEQTADLTSQFERARAERNRAKDAALSRFFSRYTGLSDGVDGDSPQLYANVTRDDEELRFPPKSGQWLRGHDGRVQ